MGRTGIAALLLLITGVGSCTTPADRPEPATSPSSAAVASGYGPADVTFARTLIPHHRAGVAIADVGASRAQNPQLRALAAEVAAAQRAEDGRITAWLVAWHQLPEPVGATPAQTVAPSLHAVPEAQFDRAFAEALSTHQAQAIALAEQEIGDGANPDAIAYAREVVRTRTEQIKQLRAFG